MATAPKPSEELTEEERADLRARGLKPVEVWVYDTSDPEFVARLREDAKKVAEADRRENMDEVLEAMNAAALEDEPDYKW